MAQKLKSGNFGTPQQPSLGVLSKGLDYHASVKLTRKLCLTLLGFHRFHAHFNRFMGPYSLSTLKTFSKTIPVLLRLAVNSPFPGFHTNIISLYEYGSQGFSGVDKGDLPQGEGRRSDYQAIRMHIPGVKGVSISIAYTPMWIEARNYHKSPLRDDSEV
ncbi:hypothetical protein ACI3LZ_002343 [Candidozyma auris]